VPSSKHHSMPSGSLRTTETIHTGTNIIGLDGNKLTYQNFKYLEFYSIFRVCLDDVEYHCSENSIVFGLAII
jgi:hypothetical protein